MKNKIKDKRALSEIVAYVLLIVIAMAIAAGVFSWIKFIIPKYGGEVCPTDSVALIVNDYSCDATLNILSLTIKNKGQFNVDGFYIYASNSSEKEYVWPLNATPNFDSLPNNNGKYFFRPIENNNSLKPEESRIINFSYAKIDSIKFIKIQPFVYIGNGYKTDLCEKSILTQRMDDC